MNQDLSSEYISSLRGTQCMTLRTSSIYYKKWSLLKCEIKNVFVVFCLENQKVTFQGLYKHTKYFHLQRLLFVKYFFGTHKTTTTITTGSKAVGCCG